MPRLYSFFVILIVCSMLSVHSAFAVEMTSPQYKLELLEDEETSETTQKILTPFETQGYIITKTIDQPFSFSVTNTTLDFGDIMQNRSQRKQTDIQVSAQGAYGYQIIGFREIPLQTLTGNTIGDTLCDERTDTCLIGLAAPWVEAESLGVGYNISGDGTPIDFINEKYYRPFADKQNSIVFASKVHSTEIAKSTLTIKLTIPKDQEEGSYHTILNIMALPKF